MMMTHVIFLDVLFILISESWLISLSLPQHPTNLVIQSDPLRWLSDPNSKDKWPPTRGRKGHELNHLEKLPSEKMCLTFSWLPWDGCFCCREVIVQGSDVCFSPLRILVRHHQKMIMHVFSTRWAPTSYKLSYNPYKWPYKWVTGYVFTLWSTNMAIENGPGNEDVFPIENGDFPASYVSLPEGSRESRQ